MVGVLLLTISYLMLHWQLLHPEGVGMTVPAEAAPNVVATHRAAVGAMNATDVPAARSAPAPAATWFSPRLVAEIHLNQMVLEP